MYYTYILKSEKTNKYYIGQTQDIKERLDKHNKGYNKSTKPGIPWVLIFSIKMETRAEAMQLEKKLKDFKSNKRLEDWMRMQDEVVGPES